MTLNLLLTLSFCSLAINAQYSPTWSSIDSRPLPTWYEDSKFGIFHVWGLYAVPAFESEWFWYHWKGSTSKIDPKVVDFMKQNYRPDFKYQDFAPQFRAEFFNATTFAASVEASGASRPLPSWYDDAKFGIFNHWGVYAVPSFNSEWFWWYWQGCKDPATVKFMKDNYRPGFRYADFAQDFRATFFDAKKFAGIIASSGAKYYVLTSKHHEGFTLWPSANSWNWNANDTGPGRDLVGELATAFKATQTKPGEGVRFGLYYSLFEWFHPLWLADKKSKFATNEYVRDVSWPQLMDIVNKYHPDVIWSDGEWEAPDWYWNSTLFLAWLYNQSPVKDSVVTNDRWGQGTMCHHGGYYTCSDRYNPGVLQPHKWENALTLDRKSWGYRRTMRIEDIMSIEELIKTLAMTISCGGNMLLNIGPTADGIIVPLFEERLGQIGKWLRQGNEEAVFGSKPWIYQNDTVNPNVWYTSKVTGDTNLPSSRLYNPQLPNGATVVYVFLLKWPQNGTVYLGAPTPTDKTKVSLLGYKQEGGNKKLQWYGGKTNNCLTGTDCETSDAGKGISVDLSTLRWWDMGSTSGWVLKLENLAGDPKKPFMATRMTKPARMRNH